MNFKLSVFVALILSIVSSNSSFAQEKFTISGYAKDSLSGESFISASIIIKELPSTGTYTNNYGFYSISLPKGTYHVSASYVGYETKVVEVKFKPSKTNKEALQMVLVNIGYQADDRKANPEALKALPLCCQPGGH